MKMINPCALLYEKVDLTPPRMVFILDGISLLGAQVRKNLCFFTCIRLFISSRAGTNRVFLPEKKPIFHHACATFNELPSNMGTMSKSEVGACV